MPYKLFPYERRLGLRELESLGLRELVDDEHCVAGCGDADRLLARVTYFEATENGDGATRTEQAAVEIAHRELREGQGRQQATRYGLHGIHEYKGKFNPQIVRALSNVVDLKAETLIDPFCGSGTALIEGLRLGMDVLGVDQSPMACFLARAKVAATTSDRHTPAGGRPARPRQPGRCCRFDRPGFSSSQRTMSPSWSRPPWHILERWFTAPAFAGLSRGLFVLGRADGLVRDLVLIAVSSILRDVSLQLPEDLRIRRRPEPYVAPTRSRR